MGDTFDEFVRVLDTSGTLRIELNAERGDIRIYSAAGEQVVHLDRTGGLILGGGSNEHGDIFMYNSTGDQTIHVSGEQGDVILRNADAAEDFTVDNAVAVTPGSVVVIDSENRLRCSDRPYDTRVAGVVSGDGHYQPAIVLDRQAHMLDRLPVALAGKVFVRVDATEHPIAAGDLLTTSTLPGHAMRVTDPTRAPGAVIGKALGSLSDSVGTVPMIVALQ